MAHSLCAVFVGVALCGLFSLETSKFFAIYDLALQQVRDYLTDGQLPSNSPAFWPCLLYVHSTLVRNGTYDLCARAEKLLRDV